MKKQLIVVWLVAMFLFSGCATYSFHYGKKPYDKGYVASRDNFTIVEYTIGKDKSVPESLDLAKQRFKRRRTTVEHYYKKMDRIENNFEKNFWSFCKMFVDVLTGVFRLPFIIMSDYKYEHNPEYREKIDKLEEEKQAREEVHIKKLKSELSNYIQQDLAKEDSQATKEIKE